MWNGFARTKGVRKMKEYELPDWMLEAMDRAKLCDTDRGTLLRLLADYARKGKEPDETLYPEVALAFWSVVCFMKSGDEAEK